MFSKNLLITGAGKGIGLQLLIDSLELANYVYAIIRKKKDYLNLKKKLENKNCSLYLGDIKNISLIDKILKDSKKENKKINCLVNNAGERQRKDFSKMTKKDIYAIFENNFFNHFFVIHKVVNFFVKNKIKNTSVVTLGSIFGQRGFKQLSGYASTKSALDGLTKSLAIEYAQNNIRFNIIHPGFVKSSYYKSFKKNEKKLYKFTLEKTPMGAWGECADVSDLILFLLSSKSKYITGQSICIDGGWTAA